jgi:hypothetical protein
MKTLSDDPEQGFALFEHKHKCITVKESGLVQFDDDEREIVFQIDISALKELIALADKYLEARHAFYFSV